MNYGFKISKPGFNVATAVSKDLILDSEIACLKFLQVGKRNFTVNSYTSANYTETITTSFPLVVLVFVYQPTSARYSQSGTEITCSFEFTASTLYIQLYNQTAGALSSTYYYYIGYA